jgi:tetratricopeptide (TPR) repeat protein
MKTTAKKNTLLHIINPMKKTLLVLALFVSSMTFAQKNEMKAVSKALKGGSYVEALTNLDKLDALLGNMDDKTKAKYYFLRVKAFNGAGQYVKAANAINTLVDFENKIGKSKYSAETKPILEVLIQNLAAKGFKEYNEKKFALAKKSFSQVYNLKKADTLKLYYAANAAYLDNDFTNALAHYLKLKDLGFTGIETIYKAKDINGRDQIFSSKSEMDRNVKMKINTDPVVEITKSEAVTIIKNIAFIYIEMGESEKAIAAIQEAKKADPTNADIIINEANIELKLGHKERFKELMKEAAVLRPNDPILFFNIGVISQNAGKSEEAKAAYLKAIELDPKYADAHLNMGSLLLEKDKKIVEELNDNINDFDKYDIIKEKQIKLYKEVIVYYEEAFKSKNNSIDLIKTMISIYENLENFDRIKELKEIRDSQ